MASKQAPQDSREPDEKPEAPPRARKAPPRPKAPSDKDPVPHLKPVYTDWALI